MQFKRFIKYEKAANSNTYLYEYIINSNEAIMAHNISLTIDQEKFIEHTLDIWFKKVLLWKNLSEIDKN